MAFSLSLDRLLTFTQGHPCPGSAPLPPHPLTGLSTDTRSLSPGQAFLALRGERFDGHQFLAQAQAQGAAVAIVDGDFQPSEADLALGLPLVQVANTLAAYQAIGQGWRRQFAIPIIGVTGSVGKTTTKELVAAMLATQGPVLKTEANYNNEIGVPKTLLNLRAEHRFAVIEMAMRGPGEIAELATIAEPTIGVITNVGVAHIERLGSREAIAAAKTELLEQMTRLEAETVQAGGKAGARRAILNADNALLMAAAAQRWQGTTATFGLEQGDLRGKLLDPETLQVGDDLFSLPLAGEHNALNFLAALAVAEAVGIPRSALTQLQVTLPGGRAKRLVWGQTEPKGQDIIALDETYNAGPESMAAALRLLKQLPGQRHLAVLGTMKELGPYSVPFHREVGELVAALAIDHLLILADPAEAEALAAGAAGVPTEVFADQASLVERLGQTLQPGDRVLFKASRSVALDQVIHQLQPRFQP